MPRIHSTISARRLVVSALIASALLLAPGIARAQISETYASKFTKIVDNCESGLAMGKASIKIGGSAHSLRVHIPKLPVLKGGSTKGGKLHAEAKSKVGSFNVHYGFNGRASGGTLQAVFVSEYFRGQVPVCTQSFRVKGTLSPQHD